MTRFAPVRASPPLSQDLSFTSSDGLRIVCRCWGDPYHATGIIRIAHGMGEHSGRYPETIALLVAAGFAVYANDHRGHGASDCGRRDCTM